MNVRVIRESGHAALIEYQVEGEAKRAVVPREAVSNGEVTQTDLDTSIPYGVAWEEILQLSVTPQEVARELRRVGIWTLQDLQAKPTVAMAALQRVYAVDVAALRRAAEKYERGE